MEHDSKFDHREHADLSDLGEKTFVDRLVGEMLPGVIVLVVFAGIGAALALTI